MESADLRWFEWREKCALGLCSSETQNELMRFALARFSLFYDQFVAHTNLRKSAGPPLQARDAWHLFETHFRLSNTREGKSYKAWLFARLKRAVGATKDTLLGGATLIMRDVVREYLRREFSPERVLSLNTRTDPDHPDSPALEDLLPGKPSPEDDPAMLEMQALAEQYAAEFFPGLTFRERIVLLAKELELSLAHPCVEQAAGCRKSAASQTYRECLTALAHHLRQLYARDDLESVRILILATFEKLRELALEWGKNEKRCAGFFLLTGQDEILAEIENMSA